MMQQFESDKAKVVAEIMEDFAKEERKLHHNLIMILSRS